VEDGVVVIANVIVVLVSSLKFRPYNPYILNGFITILPRRSIALLILGLLGTAFLTS